MGEPSNFPPGVTQDMIPGNSPKDKAWEEFVSDHLGDFVEWEDLNPKAQEKFQLAFEDEYAETDHAQEDRDDLEPLQTMEEAAGFKPYYPSGFEAGED